MLCRNDQTPATVRSSPPKRTSLCSLLMQQAKKPQKEGKKRKGAPNFHPEKKRQTEPRAIAALSEQ